MSQQNEEVQPRIIKKKIVGHGGHHGGAWKVAYADFVTAMMALFIVLWIVGQSKQVKQYVAYYFKDPGAFFENTKGGGMFEGSAIVGKEQIMTDDLLRREQQKLKEMGEQITQDLTKDESIKNLMDQIKIEVIEEGLRIELMEGKNSFFFEVGNSKLQADAIRILEIIAKEVGKLPNKTAIEGHTDSRPYSSGAEYTNFELSADRANSARRILAISGLQKNQIVEIRGYADTRLRNINNPYDIKNRRISIIIKRQEQAHEKEQAANR